MVDMAKLKEDALRRKHEHEQMERRRNARKRQSARRQSGATKQEVAGSSRSTRNTSARGSAKAQPQRKTSTHPAHKKKKRSVSRWVLDILLVLGGLFIVLMIVNPF